MAQTVDNLVIKASVEGTVQIKEMVTQTDALNASTAKTAETMKGSVNQVRQISYQLQDLAVQISGGTSAFVALGQQVPQLLGALGATGAAAGVLAAVIFPALGVAFKNAGFDTRSLGERVNDLTTSLKSYKEAQQSNLPTLEGLRDRFGTLSIEAKRFYDVNEQLAKQRSLVELGTTVEKLKNDFSGLGGASVSSVAGMGVSFEDAAMGASVMADSISLVAFRTGLSNAQAEMLSDRLKSLDKNARPTEVLKAINDIAEGLKNSGVEADKFLRVQEKVLDPLQKSAQAALAFEENIKASGEAATKLSTQLLTLQANSLPGIGDAKRRFDQIAAVQLQAAEKIREFNLQADEKSKTDSVSREAEKAAFARKTNEEARQGVLDVRHAQDEAYKAAVLTNEAKLRQLGLESKIVELQDKGRYTLSYDLQYQQDILKNQTEYEASISATEEKLRKKNITEKDAVKLNADALGIRDKENANAEEARKKRINDAKDTQTALLFELEGKKNAIGYDSEALKIRQQMRQAYPEDIETAVKINSLRDAQVEYERSINNEVRLGKKTRDEGNELINAGNDNLQRAIELERARNKEAARYRLATGREGAEDAVAKMTRENLTEYQKAGKSVEAVYSNMNSAIDRFVETGKFKFSDFTRSVLQDLIKIQMKAAASSFLSSIFGMFGFGGGGASANPGQYALDFTGIKLGGSGGASGGSMIGGMPRLVGEQGPEMFIPASSGTLLPNSALGGSQVTNVNYNIQAVDASSFRAMVARDPSFIYAVTEAGRRSQPSRRLA